MNVKAFAVGAVFAVSSLSALAGTTVYNGASFKPTPVPDRFSLYGFGRTSPTVTGSGAATSFAVKAAPKRTSFLDIWNIDTSLVKPGDYGFDAASIVATGSVLFNFITFHSVNEDGSLNVVSFDINDEKTEASGTGNFGVLKTCPIKSCVWIEVGGTQLAGSPGTGYSTPNFFVAPPSAVPEPETYALLIAGLAATAAWVSRRRSPAA